MGKHLDIGKRSGMAELFKYGHTTRAIGQRLGCSASTVSRERRRNSVDGAYVGEVAHAQAAARKPRPGARTFTQEMRDEVVEMLACGFTPDGISGRPKLEGRAMVSHETIYQFIYADARAGGQLHRELPRSRRKRRRRCPRADSRPRIPNRRPIEERPPVAKARGRLGDMEGDTMVCGNNSARLVTLVDRRSRYALVRRVADGTKDNVTAALVEMLNTLPPRHRHTVTYDNGLEFAGHEVVAAKTGAVGFFAAPYHSWERGTNENTNGLIRRFLPKGESFAGLADQQVARIQDWLNHRPRKVLGWLTPHEVMIEGAPIPRQKKLKRQDRGTRVVPPAAPPPLPPAGGIPLGERALEPREGVALGGSKVSLPRPLGWAEQVGMFFKRCCICYLKFGTMF